MYRDAKIMSYIIEGIHGTKIMIPLSINKKNNRNSLNETYVLNLKSCS